MDPDTAAAFQRLKEADPSNKRCLECDAPEPQWCALSYGAFVCLNCSGLHRGLGVHLSFVRSSTMDAWQPQQLKLMECGGNSKCKNFFVEYGVWDLPFKERYATKAAAYYRALLRSSAEPSVAAPPPLQREEAAQPDAAAAASPPYSSSNSIRSLGSGIGNPQQQQEQQDSEKEEEGFIASLQQQAAAASAAAAAAAATVSSTGGAALGTAFQNVSSFVSGAKEYTAKTIEAAGESGIIEKAKGGLQSGSEWIAQQGKKLSSTFTGGDEEETSSSASPPSKEHEQEEQQQQQQEPEPQRSSSGVLQSMRDLTRRSLSNVSQVVRSGSNSAEGNNVLDKARESLSYLTNVATGWLQPAEVPPPECGAADGVETAADSPEKFL
ncbi:ARF1-directed GTPase-activating protein, putative [Eimeria tenella]|uniref:ARF1-directed GTPase-activating protein, putative n=1 Tax=Eimeria tenella TaxID=5802 RepID=U6KPL8_EIMTE|nr:ARF1-directed GTPase-activating protein, putative [Eimeria tenella]CDJ38247.1 ARF1-directed GTPase-activating protein, putative [Eimeria tenella]|eukprot:XP_013229085.1 ARF1-directed GTPase-activating protein, putative [Eimeria tenella]